MKKICLLLTFVFVMLLGVSALADMDVKELTVQFVPTNTETADATTAEFSAYMTELMGIPVKMTVATSYNAIVEALESGTVDVGIMPVLDMGATINMALSRNGCVMPRKLAEIISKHWIFPNPFAPNESEESIAAKKASFKEAGIEYTIKLIDEYRVCGINGIHLYALNKYDDVARIVKESGIVDLI